MPYRLPLARSRYRCFYRKLPQNALGNHHILGTLGDEPRWVFGLQGDTEDVGTGVIVSAVSIESRLQGRRKCVQKYWLL